MAYKPLYATTPEKKVGSRTGYQPLFANKEEKPESTKIVSTQPEPKPMTNIFDEKKRDVKTYTPEEFVRRDFDSLMPKTIFDERTAEIQKAKPVREKKFDEKGKEYFEFPEHLLGGGYYKEPTDLTREEKKIKYGGVETKEGYERDHIVSVFLDGIDTKENIRMRKSGNIIEQFLDTPVQSIPTERRQEGKLTKELEIYDRFKDGEVSREQAITELKRWEFEKELEVKKLDVVVDTFKTFLKSGSGLFTEAIPSALKIKSPIETFFKKREKEEWKYKKGEDKKPAEEVIKSKVTREPTQQELLGLGMGPVNWNNLTDEGKQVIDKYLYGAVGEDKGEGIPLEQLEKFPSVDPSIQIKMIMEGKGNEIKNLVPKKPGLSPFYAGIGDVISTVGSASKWIESKADKKDGATSSKLTAFGQKLQQEFSQPEEVAELGDFDWKDTINPTFYKQKALRSIPFTLAIIPAAIAGGYAGTGVAGAAGLGTFGTYVLGAVGAASFARPIESAMEAGGAYEEAIGKGMSEDEANEAANKVFTKNLALTGMDAAEFATMFLPTRKLGLGRSLSFGGKMIMTGGMEYGEEILQDKFQKESLGEEWQFSDPATQEAGFLGLATGVMSGGVGDAYTSLKGKVIENFTPDSKKQFDDVKFKELEKGKNNNQAELVALDEVAKTKDGKKAITNAIQDIQKEAPTTPPTAEVGAEPTITPKAPEIAPEVAKTGITESIVAERKVAPAMATSEELITYKKTKPLLKAKPVEAKVEAKPQVITGKEIKQIGETKFKTPTEKTLYQVKALTGKYQGKDIISNSYVLEIGKLPEGAKAITKDDLGDLSNFENFANAQKNLVKLSEPTGYIPLAPNVNQFVFGKGENAVAIDAEYYNYFVKKYKGVEFFVNSKEKYTPLVAKQNGEFVGFIMPIRDSSMEKMKPITQKVEEPTSAKALTIKPSQKPQEAPVKPKPAPSKEVAGDKVSGVAKSIEAKAIEQGLVKDGFDKLAGFDKTTLKEQAKMASDLFTDIEKTRRVIRGEETLPLGLKGISVITAMEEHMKTLSDSDSKTELAMELANSPLATKVSLAAQEVSLAQGRDLDSATVKLNEIKKAREAKAEKVTKKKKSDVKNKLKEQTKKINLKESEVKWDNFLAEITC